MRNLKRLIALALSTTVAVVLIVWLLDAYGVRSPLFAFLANWVAMSWVAFAGQFFQILLPPGYYAPRPFERSGRAYERLGIRLFKAMVRRGPLAIFSPTLRLPGEKTASALRALETEMCKAEAGHLLVFVLILIMAVYVLLRGWPDAAAWLTLFNIPFNAYPVILQRYNRIKLHELVQRLAAAETARVQAQASQGSTGLTTQP